MDDSGGSGTRQIGSRERAENFERRLAAAASGVRPETSSYDRFVLKYANSYSRILRHLIASNVPVGTHLHRRPRSDRRI